jgi:ATP-dependent helicase/nuclease subunit A
MTTSLQKPKESQWTDDQWRAIVEKGQDILVAAAAGSGKTAVLVERIIKQITDPEKPLDVDRLLIVTFTNAAAAEMRGRIGQALEKELTRHPNDARLREQLVLLGKAHIMTFHAFCQSVIRKYYYKLDLDPGFRVAEQTEAELIREDVLEALFEDYYASEDKQEAFYQLVDRYSNDRSDRELFELVQKLYDFSQSHPWPEQWLNDLATRYMVPETGTIEEVAWFPSLKASIQERLEGCLLALAQAEAIAGEPGGPHPYLETLATDRQLIEGLLEATRGPWDQAYEKFAAISYKNLKACKGSDFNEVLKDQVKAIREDIKKVIDGVRLDGFAQTPDSYVNDLREMAPFTQHLVNLVKAFGEAYKAAKREKGLLDFNDLEHDCLAILRDQESTPNQEKPSDVALTYRAMFDELLIDEYQDTNQVQETVLLHVSRGGNRFMVGDVKQSIYRFRLAEPALFLEKYKTFQGFETDSSSDTTPNGIRIDLSQNFRSRQEVLSGTNFIFAQIMDEAVGEIDYDERAALRFGSRDYDEKDLPVELHLVDGATEEEEGDTAPETETYQNAELEAHLIATQIEQLLTDGMTVFDKSLGRNRPLQYKDIVILLRSVQGTAHTILDVLNNRGIPAYAELSTGYFEAVEVSIMMSLLKTIDNPYQDIPLVSVLRSPIVGLTGKELAEIRLVERRQSFIEAIQLFIDANQNPLTKKLKTFLKQLETWRNRARRGALAELVWQIYQETGYYDYVAGLTQGDQRQANLKALYDRARQYEQTSFRGLFRFLRFIERLQDKGRDLGEARALSEQEDVVRVMTIHKSKGLEFPVVFVAGISKRFNQRDASGKTLLHKSLGFGTKLIDPEARYTLPTLAQTAIRRQTEKETRAEEMRILYVALTRAREKLILVGAVPDAGKALQKWSLPANQSGWLLPAYYRTKGNSYLDWIGPAVYRHQNASVFHDLTGDSPKGESPVTTDSSRWVCALHPRMGVIKRSSIETKRNEKEAHLRNFEPVETGRTELKEEVNERLSWTYPNLLATTQLAKFTVTEIKRQQDHFSEGAGETFIRQLRRPIGDRPAFLSKKESTASELGTLTHRFMQHVTLKPDITLDYLRNERERLIQKELLEKEEAERLALDEIQAFFDSEIGRRFVDSPQIIRELPFSLSIKTSEVVPSWMGEQETLLVQGVIDCLFRDENGWNLLDYKTDRVSGRFHSEEETLAHLRKRYHVPMTLYQQAIEKIWRERVVEVGLWFFDGSRYIKLTKEGQDLHL